MRDNRGASTEWRLSAAGSCCDFGQPDFAVDNHYPLADKMAASHFTPMEHLIWSPSEKRLARKLFDNALQRELADLVMDFRKRAEAVQTPDEMWKLRRFLEQTEREVEEKYDYRYSQMLFVFGRLVREGRISISQLQELSAEKLSYFRKIVSL